MLPLTWPFTSIVYVQQLSHIPGRVAHVTLWCVWIWFLLGVAFSLWLAPDGYTVLPNFQPSRSVAGSPQMPSEMPVLRIKSCLSQSHIGGAGLSRLFSLAFGELSWEVYPVSGAQMS